MCLQRNDYYFKGIINVTKTWNHLALCLLLVLRMIIRSYDYLQRIILISYITPYKCLQIIGARKEYLKPYKQMITIKLE